MAFNKRKTVEKFIKEFQIQVGRYKIPTYKIYYEYLKFVWNGYKLSKIEFFRTFNKFFESRRHGNQRYYLLNECFDLSTEAMEKAEKYDKAWQRGKNGKQKKQKIKV